MKNQERFQNIESQKKDLTVNEFLRNHKSSWKSLILVEISIKHQLSEKHFLDCQL